MGVLRVRERLLAVARGDAAADLLLTGAQVVDVFTGSVIDAEVAVVDGVIASVGPARDAIETVDLTGRFLLPGLIDAHDHHNLIVAGSDDASMRMAIAELVSLAVS